MDSPGNWGEGIQKQSLWKVSRLLRLEVNQADTGQQVGIGAFRKEGEPTA